MSTQLWLSVSEIGILQQLRLRYSVWALTYRVWLIPKDRASTPQPSKITLAFGGTASVHNSYL